MWAAIASSQPVTTLHQFANDNGRPHRVKPHCSPAVTDYEEVRGSKRAETRIRRAGGRNTTFGSFVEGSAGLGPVTLTGGARLDHWSIRNGFLSERLTGTGAPSLDLRYADRAGLRPTFRGGAIIGVTNAVDLRAAGYTGFRVPTLNELYRPFRVGADATAANGGLGLERLKGFEGGIGFHSGDATLGITMFWNTLDGAIANATLGTGPGIFPQVGFVAAGGVFRQRANVDAIEVGGLEATANARLGTIKASASYAYTDAKVRASGPAQALDGKRPAQTPHHQASATLAYMPGSGTEASLTLRYAGPQFEDDLELRRLPRALTMDGAVSIPLIRNIRLVARAENLFDEAVVSGISSTGIEDLGTPQTFWLGLSFAG